MPPDDRPPAEPTPTPPPALQYDTRPSPITRRQMNVFLLLLFINTLLFAGFVCLPSASPWLKQTWADFQARRAEKKKKAAEAAALAAALKDCLNYTMPPDKVVYVEAPADVPKLLTSDGRSHTLSSEPNIRSPEGGGYNSIESRRLFANLVWQPPAMTHPAAPLNDLSKAFPEAARWAVPLSGATVFLHEMKTPSGQRRLVCVNLQADQVVIHSGGEDRRGGGGGGVRTASAGGRLATGRFDLQTRRSLRATVIDPQNPTAAVVTAIALDDSREVPPPMSGSDNADSSPPLQRTIRPGPQWKIFAGQPDPADPTHLIIRYEIDGKPGLIDGRLNDGDRLMLIPQIGKFVAWRNGYEYTWDMNATPTTQPATTRPSATSASP